MTTDSTPSKKRSLLRKLLYAAAAVILLGSLLASYMNWEANHLEFSENTAPAGCVPGLSGTIGLSPFPINFAGTLET